MAPRTSRAAGVRTTRRTTVAQTFDALTVEGALIATAQLALVAGTQAEGQDETAYCVPRGLTLRDEIPRYFRIAQALWKDLAASDTTSTAATVVFVERLMRDVLGFADVTRAPVRAHDGRTHPVTLEALGGRVPVIVARPSDTLDRPSPTLSIDGRRTSAALALQDWLNAAEDTLWGLACNGEKLRLVRDNPSLTRPAYIEADLRRMFEGDAFADFTALWLLLHASRFGSAGAPVTDCVLEHWREAGQKAGVAARDRLRDGFEEALRALGTGFLSHPDNGELRRRLEAKELGLLDFHGLLLRLVYRLIFLLVAEDRNLLHPPGAPPVARTLYAEGYSLSRLRGRSAKRAAWDVHDDLWDGLQITFMSLARGESALALPALAGLFANGALGDLENCALPNRALMRAIYRLAWLKDGGTVVPVNWRDMETEELGSVYESLLELTPRMTDSGRGYGFADGPTMRGNQRKTTGSYYTPDSLVQALLDSALDPVLDRAERESSSPVQALLDINIIDPACGSGHFLLAAARRLATRLARQRAGGTASAEDYRHALRDVARTCIHGVDRNPMAVELTKVALWIETVEPGKPLGFLDANIRCGDALVGVFDLEALIKGVPDAAYKPLAGDHKGAARVLLRRNKAERDGQGTLDFSGGGGTLPPAAPMVRAAQAWRALPEDSPEDIVAKRARFEASRAASGAGSLFTACDLYTAAFLAPKALGSDDTEGAFAAVTTNDIWRHINGAQILTARETAAASLARDSRAFHWPLEFPDVFANGGFDVVLGNPPWEVVQLKEEEYFAEIAPEIAELIGSARKNAIVELANSSPVVFARFQKDKHEFESTAEFYRGSERFPRVTSGKINTYALFSELVSYLYRAGGSAGIIVPTGIITDSNTRAFLAGCLDNQRLLSVYSFDNKYGLFPAVHRDTAFSLITLGNSHEDPKFTYDITAVDDVSDLRRVYRLNRRDLSLMNPNTLNAPVFRSVADAGLVRSIYSRLSALAPESGTRGWDVSFVSMFNMAADQSKFRTSQQLERDGYAREGRNYIKGRDATGNSSAPNYIPLFEGKMIDHYNHRGGTFENIKSRPPRGASIPEPDRILLEDCEYEVRPWYWVQSSDVDQILSDLEWHHQWTFGYSFGANPNNERTLGVAIIPRAGTPHVLIQIIPKGVHEKKLSAALVANLNSIVVDYICRQKMARQGLDIFIVKQLPVLLPDDYSAGDLEFIVQRVIELTFTSWSLKSFASDMGYEGQPYPWDEDRRARLRAELDAWFARAYGLSRDELRFVLDPTDVMGPEYPSETFRVLKDKEVRSYGEFRTRRLVLEAWDAQEASSQTSVAVPVMHPSVRVPREWARPAADISSIAVQTRAQVAAVLKALDGPTPEREVRLAALYALEPSLLTARLAGAERAQWIRAVGSEATLASSGVVSFGLGGGTGWAEALRQLRAQNALVVDAARNTWSPGPGLTSYFTDGWPERAGFALVVAGRVLADQATGLTADELRGVSAIAA